MAKDRECDGIVEQALPRGLFRVRCEDGNVVTASLGGATRSVTVNVLPGDRVSIEVSPFAPGRGRIKTRKK